MNTTDPPGQNAAPRRNRVLVVDDDLTSREFLRAALESGGWAVVVAGGVAAAQAELMAQGFAAFDCVVSDYQMPEMTGLDLLAWIKEWDACLATLILTSMGEKQLVADSLRGGAVDFLEKPVDLQKLHAAIRQAVALTQRQRLASEVQLSVQELGRTQARLLEVQSAGLPVQADVCFHPKLAAGGDFFSHFQPAPDKFCCLLTDVSGHDLQAAYLSAYFQGIVRGMLARTASLPEVFTYFNHLLLHEWNGLIQSAAGTSAAVCALLLDLERQTVDVITCGTPAPVYVAPDGRVRCLTPAGGHPLGWFADCAVSATRHQAAPGGVFLLWSDGLEDLAEKNRVSALSMGMVLQRARSNLQLPAEVAAAADDILLAEVRLPAGGPVPDRWQPVVFEEYHGGQAAEIDQLQAWWSRSVNRAVPELTGPRIHDLLLAAREALLNALHHGCQDDAARRATFQISWQAATRTLRVWVDDPGPGHHFDLAAHEHADHTGLVDHHRGLILIKRLARRLTFERAGAGLIMDFEPGSAADAPPAAPETRPAHAPRETAAPPSIPVKPAIQFDSESKVLVIHISGDLTSTSVQKYNREIEPALAVPSGDTAPWKTVTLHLATAKMVDSMGLNFIVKIYKAAQQAGARMRVVCVNPNVHRTLLFTRLDQQLELIKV